MGEFFSDNCDNILTVSAVNRYIKEIMSRDLILSNLWVRGEISNFKYHSSVICILPLRMRTVH